MYDVRFLVTGVSEAVGNILNGPLSDKNLALGLDDASAIFLSRTRKRFLQEQDPFGRMWPKSLAAIRRKGQTLYDTGELFRSLQVVREDLFARALMTDVDYADDHQFGIGQVRRQFLGIGKGDVDIMTKAVARRMEKGIK